MGKSNISIQRQLYGTAVDMTITALKNMATSPTVGWQSDRIDLTSIQCIDLELFIRMNHPNTSPGGTKSVYLYIVPWFLAADGSTWYATDMGTNTLPTGTQGTATIASPNDLIPLGALSYTAADITMQKLFHLSNVFPKCLPDGISIIVINDTGATTSNTNGDIVLQYKPINILI